MLYLSIELCKYRRVNLTNIKYIRFTPASKIQLILGTNGSGKSSIMSQILPLVASHQDYEKGGYRVLEISHNNNHYLLKNMFLTTGNEYQFIKNGVDLNEGGTATTYQVLVKQEFNITPDVQDVMLGSTKFHEMSVSERRTWFTKISDSDYTYAIQYFNKLKNQHRGTVEAVKVFQSRLVQESNKLLTPEEEAKYRYEITLFKELLTKALESKIPVNVNKGTVYEEISKIKDNLKSMSSLVDNYNSEFLNSEGFKNIEDINLSIIDTQANIRSQGGLIEDLYKTLEVQDKTLQTLKESNLGDVVDIDKTVDELVESIASFKKQIIIDIPVTDAFQMNNALLSVNDVLNETLSDFPANSDKTISRDTYVLRVEEKASLLSELLHNETIIKNLSLERDKLLELKNHEELQCPSCDHKWHKHPFDEARYNSCLIKITYHSEQIDRIKARIIEVDKDIDVKREYLEKYRTYSNIISQWSVLKPLWDYIYSNNFIFDNPRKITTILNDFKLDLNIWMKIEESNKKLKDAFILKEMVSKNQETSISNLIKHTEQLNSKLFELNCNLQKDKAKLVKLNGYRTAAITLSKLTPDIESQLKELEVKKSELLNISKVEYLNEVIRVIQLELVQRETVLSKVEAQKALVSSIEEQIKELVAKAEVLKMAVTELSPSQGLIAKGLTGFINRFLGSINAFIKQIWLYPMELIAVEPDVNDEVDLDYKFAVKINDDYPISDISKGSAGMKEIIDLAFVVVSMVYLGLEAAPLFLDEFAKGFDKAHRESAHHVITNLLTTANFSQIFMISHYENAYGSMNNADVTVLCSNNIGLPKNLSYNKTTVIK